MEPKWERYENIANIADIARPPEIRIIPDPDPCQALGCAMQTEPVDVCGDQRCPHRWTREGREDWQRWEEKDARRGEA